jgi:two-component system, cell cycle response regulator
MAGNGGKMMHSTTALIKAGAAALLASPDVALIADLRRIFNSLDLCVETVTDADSALSALLSVRDGGHDWGIVLLDVRLPGVASGRLLATMDEYGVHKRCAIALIAEQVSDEWIARLREGVIDDIVPRNTDASGWNTHLHSMQRGHQLYCELELLREASLLEVRHDRLTGVLNRETMLTLLFRETDRVQRLRGTLSMILLEIDDMAHWERKLGSEACDGLRREVAVRTGRILRSYDLLGRSGENEFLLAMPGCSTINAMMLTERLPMDIFGEPFAVNLALGERAQVQLSACFAVAASRGRSPVVVLREAELALAQGRLSGRDTLLCASQSPLSAETDSGAAAARLFPDTELVSR